jgi:hypothetical protein
MAPGSRRSRIFWDTDDSISRWNNQSPHTAGSFLPSSHRGLGRLMGWRLGPLTETQWGYRKVCAMDMGMVLMCWAWLMG